MPLLTENDCTTIHEKNGAITDTTKLQFPDINRRLLVDRTFVHLWLILDEGSRWLILDNLVRFHHWSNSDERRLAKQNWSRFKFRCIEEFSYESGTVDIRPKRHDSEDCLSVRYKTSNKQRCALPLEDGHLYKGSLREIAFEDLLHEKHISMQNCQLRDNSKNVEIDPLVRDILSNIPSEVYDSVLKAIANRHLTVNMTGVHGELTSKGKRQPAMGVAYLQKKSGGAIVPWGEFNEQTYFQNGWLMMKLGKMPNTLAYGLKSGSKTSVGDTAEDLLQITINDQSGNPFEPFAGFEISERKTGTTSMGPHVMLKFERRNA